ncbi:MAG: DUF3991 and TOPRIM domain-containing protein [Clostridia bacterium]|nr:DUF3991 and TOPRIM domain-containing protein [Clostridia bacterium]MBO5530551.1 DUF3991 and TOPRIM domain-containing protein [Bacilli bacterium]
MAYYNQETINRVKSIDLLSYLQNYEPDNLVHFSRDTYCTKEHDSLKISNGMWYWFSKGIGGVSALDYLIKVRNIEFKNAVEILLNKVGEITPIERINKNKESDKFILPERNINNNKVISYLKNRCIDMEIIKECISKDILYEDKFHNAVFLGYDKNNNIRYAFIRGTNSSRFMKEAYGSHKAFSFKLDSEEESNVLHLFESAIDLLSYATLNKNNYCKENLLSLAGVYQSQKNIEDSKLPLVLNYYLNQHQNIRKIYLHFDNDDVGRGATITIKYLLEKLHYEVIDEPSKIGKDYNDYLKYKSKGCYER